MWMDRGSAPRRATSEEPSSLYFVALPSRHVASKSAELRKTGTVEAHWLSFLPPRSAPANVLGLTESGGTSLTAKEDGWNVESAVPALQWDCPRAQPQRQGKAKEQEQQLISPQRKTMPVGLWGHTARPRLGPPVFRVHTLPCPRGQGPPSVPWSEWQQGERGIAGKGVTLQTCEKLLPTWER